MRRGVARPGPWHVGVIKTVGSLRLRFPFRRIRACTNKHAYVCTYCARFFRRPRRWLFPDFAAWESRRCILDVEARWFSVESLRRGVPLFSQFPYAAAYHRLVPMITSIDHSLFARWRGVLWLLRVLLYPETGCNLSLFFSFLSSSSLTRSAQCFVYVDGQAAYLHIVTKDALSVFHRRVSN